MIFASENQEMVTISRSARRAFTLVELLVVIGLVCFLFALLMPFCCQTREPSRRSRCQNNLKEFGLALHNYHDIHGSLPSGFASVVSGGTSRANWGTLGPMNRVGWQVRLLPFIEQSVIYDQLNWSLPDASQRVYNNSGNGVTGSAANTVLSDGLPARQHNFPAAARARPDVRTTSMGRRRSASSHGIPAFASLCSAMAVCVR